jgi:dipeptidase D
LRTAAERVQARAQRSHGESNCAIAVGALDAHPDAAAAPDESRQLIGALVAAPSGVLAIVPDIPGLVQTSNNISTIVGACETGMLRVVVGCLSRSSSADDITWATQQVCAAGELGGATTDVGNQYPGWQPDPQSKLLSTCKDVYADVFKHEPKVLAIHAGLECGIIGERVGGGLEMISFGPNIRGAHSPDERVYVDSVERIYGYLRAVLERLASA